MIAAKEETLSSFPWCAHPALAADLFAEQPRLVVRTFNPRKPHQGVTSKNPALHLGQRGWKSKHALGLRGVESRTRVRSRCTGKERDSETGLDDFGARYYASNMGRFMSPDPLSSSARPANPQTWNRYAYVHNNPLAFADFEGLIDYYVFRGVAHSSRFCLSGGSAYSTGITITNEYNPRLQPTHITANAGPATLIDRTYIFEDNVTHNNNGNVLQIVDNIDGMNLANRPNGSVAFTYDSLNRITSVATPGTNCTVITGNTPATRDYGNSYTIDPWGNLKGKTVTKCSAESLSQNADFSNRLSGFGSYDIAGNLVGNNAYSYDAENRIKTLVASGVTYTYDGDGERVKKSTGTLYYGGSGTDALSEANASGAIVADYVFFGGKRIARIDNPGATETVHYYLSDHLGSHSVVASAAGVQELETMFFPYGGERWSTGTDSNHYKFTGKERDSETGLDYFGARYYGSNAGRFMSPDSASYSNSKDPQSWNLYAYSLNNPVTFKDADGHEIVCANNAEQCKKDAAAATGSAEAAKRVTTNTVTTKHSFLGLFSWTTSKTTIAITGDMNSFRALGQNAGRLADLVTDKQTITVSYDTHAKPSFWGQPLQLNGGAMSYVPSQGYDAQGFIDPNRTPGVTYDTDAAAQGVPQANTAEEFGHEVLGHIWGELNGGHTAGTRGNMRDSITGENAVRRLDPTRGQKGLESHHGYSDAKE